MLSSGSVAGDQGRFPTGIVGLDAITDGGLPRGRVTAVVGPAGSGKTMLALETLTRGASAGEPGVFVGFEEPIAQVAGYGARFEWPQVPEGALEFLDASLPASALHGGEFDLNGLLATLGARCKAGGVRRVVFDGIDVLLAHLADPAAVRRELFRLREWILESGISALVTAKADADGRLEPAYEFLQFMADCVVSMSLRLTGRTAMRGLRIAKLRGAPHSANEFPFAFGLGGLEVAAGAEPEMRHVVLTERVSAGIDRLDAMLDGGYFRGTSVLISGAPGTAKTTLAGAFARAACERGEPTLFISFDEMGAQIVRNLASVGIHLGPHVESGLLRMCSLRTRALSPEAHVVRIRALLREHGARNLVVDPVSAFSNVGDPASAEGAALQIVDLAKGLGVTLVGTTLLANENQEVESTPVNLSTVADTWMHLAYVSRGGERNRALSIVKSRGMGHSNQVRELVLSSEGVSLSDVYTAGGEVLMGTLRWEREEAERDAVLRARRDAERRRREAELALAETDAQMLALRKERELRLTALERLADERTGDAERKGEHLRALRRLRGGGAEAEGGDEP